MIQTTNAVRSVMEVPEPGDEPTEEPGDCKMNICNAAGYPDTMTLNGMPGCCAEDVYPSMAIDPSCTTPQVVISVESTLPFCAGCKLEFHH